MAPASLLPWTLMGVGLQGRGKGVQGETGGHYLVHLCSY